MTIRHWRNEEAFHRSRIWTQIEKLFRSIWFTQAGTRESRKESEIAWESCKPCTQLIKYQFSRLQLKGVPFRVPEEASDRDIDELFKSLNLDKSKTPYNCVDDLRKRPKLTQYLAHCCRQRTYFFSVKKCGSQNCEICLPPRSIAQDFERLGHLPDPTPSSDNLHYKPFQEVFKTETEESAMPSLKTLKDRCHKIPFNPAKGHAANTILTVECAECSKPRLVYAARKISASEKKKFHIVMGSALFTCDALLAEFKSIDLNTKKAECLDKLFVRANLSCIKPIEALDYPERCAQCGSKRSLQKTVNAHPICKPCKEVKKKIPVLKRKRKNVAAEKDD